MDRSSSATRAYGLIMEKFSQTALACLFLLFVVQVNGYSKYGRTCKDIGCTSTEVCRIVDECDPNGYRCGYPTCEKVNAKLSCQTMNCAGGQNCIMENGHPKCVDDPKLGYNSAGVSIVNGQRTSNDNTNNNQGSVSTYANPYANANAPPYEPDSGRNPLTNLGYPPDPRSTSNSNNNYNNGNHGSYQPSSSSSGSNLGYPPYPTQNRMPMPGQTGIYQQPPPQAGGYYPGNSASGYPLYPTNQQYPSHSNYPYQTRNYNSNAHYPRYRNGAFSITSLTSVINVLLGGMSIVFLTNYLS